MGDEALYKAFMEADSDGDGVLSVNEFFRWVLARQLNKGTLLAVFQGYDKGSGFLDEVTFCKLATDIGFGAAAHDIFRELDAEGSGSVEYSELVAGLEVIQQRASTTQPLGWNNPSHNPSYNPSHNQSHNQSHNPSHNHDKRNL